jgi:2-oxoglutarate/2-oxoacid ferredoxin oxidoreductase subunit alpha
MKVNVLIGGKAGQGPNVVTRMLAESLIEKGYYVFYSRDYQSLIRGGHNFNVLTFSNEPVHSNESKIDVLVAFDDKTEGIHKKDLKKSGIIVVGKESGMYFAGRLFKILGFSLDVLKEKLMGLKNFDENFEQARLGFLEEKRSLFFEESKKEKLELINGSQGIAEGSIKSGLDLYYAYPMTPATPLLFELAGKQEENNFLCLELENEIAVANAALGSSATGAKALIGTSGGGFDLMTEAFSMAGQAEIPFVVYLASRPGPSTGSATYSGQGDLQLARFAGHGEFFRLVVAPGDPKECQELMGQAFYFSQKYKIPTIVLSDKHLAESFFSLSGKVELTLSRKLLEFGRFNSYEHIETGESTEDALEIGKNVERRLEKTKEIEKEAEKFEGFKIYGDRKSKNIVLSYGSTKGAILDSIKDLDCKFIQILYIEPFPKEIEKELGKAKKIVLVENSATGMLADVVREKTGIEIQDRILRYDGRPFLSDELNDELRKKLR